MAHEWPVAFAAVPPAIAALVSGLIPDLTVADGVWAALIVAVAEQQLWGYAAVRQRQALRTRADQDDVAQRLRGLIIVALKLSILGH